MNDKRTVGDILERLRTSRRRKRCPHCSAVVSIRGVNGEYRWECPDCDAIGIGYTSRDAAQDGLQIRRR